MDNLDHLKAYYAASPAERADMIRQHYEKQNADRLNAFIAEYERRHGEGSYVEYRARLDSWEVPEHLSIDLRPSNTDINVSVKY